MTDELQHHGIIGQKWGVRRFQNKDGSLTPAGKRRYESSDSPFTASNGVKVGKARNAAIAASRKIGSTRAIENANVREYRRRISKYDDTNTNRLNAAKGEEQIRKEAAALREYNAHQKDLRRNTGTKYLDKAVAANRYYDAQEKVRTATTKADRLIYNEATRNLAAKYIAKNNIPVNQAIKKAKGAAWRNTATFVAVTAAVALADIKMK